MMQLKLHDGALPVDGFAACGASLMAMALDTPKTPYVAPRILCYKFEASSLLAGSDRSVINNDEADEDDAGVHTTPSTYNVIELEGDAWD